MRVETATADTHPALNVGQRVILRGIRGYQLLFAPMYAGACRFVPSCSAYASEAVASHGVLRGGGLAVRRLLRCRPFGGHGHDPVPAFAPSKREIAAPSDSKTH